MTSRTCADCSSPISRQARRCRACAVQSVNRCPDVAQARAHAIRAKFRDPAHRAKMQQVARRNGETARLDPAFRARLVEHGKRQYARHLNTPEGRAAVLATRPASGAKRTETVLGWCPAEWRAEYRRLTSSKQVKAADARRMILDIIDARKARVEALSPFERQERAILRGVGLVANADVYRDFR